MQNLRKIAVYIKLKLILIEKKGDPDQNFFFFKLKFFKNTKRYREMFLIIVFKKYNATFSYFTI